MPVSPTTGVRDELLRIKGIGSWTVDIYLLMALRRPDIWPRGDLALVTAAHEVKRLAFATYRRGVREARPGSVEAMAPRSQRASCGTITSARPRNRRVTCTVPSADRNTARESYTCADCGVTLVGAPPPVSDDELVTVFNTTDPALFPIVKSVLDAAGIPYLVQGEEHLGLFPLGLFGAAVFVARARARSSECRPIASTRPASF